MTFFTLDISSDKNGLPSEMYERVIIDLDTKTLSFIYTEILKKLFLFPWEIDCWKSYCKSGTFKYKDLINTLKNQNEAEAIQKEFLSSHGFLVSENNISKKINGHELFFDFDATLIENFYLGEYEKNTVDHMNKLIKKNMNVINIGANIGYMTLIIARLVGEHGKVFAFEPHPKSVEFLNTNISENGYHNVEVIQKAVSNKTGDTTLFNNISSAWHSLGTKTGPGNWKRIPVQTITIDDFLKDKNTKIDFIVIDAEGSEKHIIDGMEKTLEQNPKIEIITEYNPVTLEFVDSSGTEFLDAIERMGFSIYLINDKNNKVELTTKDRILTEFPRNAFTNLYLTRKNNTHKISIVKRLFMTKHFKNKK